jgi:hypothetical protein
MNCWGAKHNEVVYIPASKTTNTNRQEYSEGYEHLITYGKTVMWCRDTTAEKLLKAINTGVIYLDPAPKLHSKDSAKNKRRAQWRVNDIAKAAQTLYDHVEFRQIADTGNVIEFPKQGVPHKLRQPQGRLFPE